MAIFILKDSSIKKKKKKVFLFDYDQKGIQNFKKICKKIEKSNDSLSNAMYIKDPQAMSRYEKQAKIVTIEKLFPFEKVKIFLDENFETIRLQDFILGIQENETKYYTEYYYKHQYQPELLKIKT